MARFIRNKRSENVSSRSPKPVIYVAAEGRKTELEYLDLLNNVLGNVQLSCLSKGNQSAPSAVLKKFRAFLGGRSLQNGDSAWIFIDIDNWPQKQIDEIIEWTGENPKGVRFGCAISNPCFEYWLVLHFEKGNSEACKKDPERQLKKHRRNYNKSIPANFVGKEEVIKAIGNAKERPLESGYPKDLGSTTVHKAIEYIWCDDIKAFTTPTLTKAV